MEAIDWVPWGLGWLADKIRDLWNGLMDKIKEFFDPLVQIPAGILIAIAAAAGFGAAFWGAGENLKS